MIINTGCRTDIPAYYSKWLMNRIREGYVLVRNPYYPKSGYIPAINYGIKAPFDVANENFMAIKLNETNEKIEGIVRYAKEFGI